MSKCRQQSLLEAYSGKERAISTQEDIVENHVESDSQSDTDKKPTVS